VAATQAANPGMSPAQATALLQSAATAPSLIQRVAASVASGVKALTAPAGQPVVAGSVALPNTTLLLLGGGLLVFSLLGKKRRRR